MRQRKQWASWWVGFPCPLSVGPLPFWAVCPVFIWSFFCFWGTDGGDLLVGLHLPQQFRLQMSFVFPNSVLACPSTVSVFHLGGLSLFLPTLCLLHQAVIATSPAAKMGSYVLLHGHGFPICPVPGHTLCLHSHSFAFQTAPSFAPNSVKTLQYTKTKVREQLQQVWKSLPSLIFLSI